MASRSSPAERPRPAKGAAGPGHPSRTRGPAKTRAGRVALVGRANVGKSTLFNALVGERLAITSRHPQTTRSTVRGVLTSDDSQYLFVDTPGLHEAKTRLGHRMNAAARTVAAEADAIVLVTEAPRQPLGRPDPADVAIAEGFQGPRTVLVINKIDRIAEKAALLPVLAAFSEGRSFAAVIPLSARRADGVERLLAELWALLPEQPFLYDGETLSDQPARFFVAEFVRGQILERVAQEVPHGVAVVVDRFDETHERPLIEVTAHVAREAHKKILIGAGGQMIKQIGIAARARIEGMLGRPVNLRLWVRATPGWMDDDGRLRELGYGPDESAT
jgi:GTPase